MELNWDALHTPGLVSLGLAALLVLASSRARALAQAFLQARLSGLINWFLCLYYPVRHGETGQPLPTCPYQWPNGQGDVAKFLDGLSNRKAWGSTYGSIYRIWSGTHPEVVLTRAQHVQEVFRDSHRHTKAPNNNSGYFLGEILGQCVGLISGRSWEALKAAVDAPFVHARMRDHIGIVQRRTRSFLSSPELQARLASGRVDPVADFKMLPFWIVAEILFGPLDAADEARLAGFCGVREALFRHAIAGGLVRFRLAELLPLAPMRELRAFKRDWAAFAADMRRRNAERGTPAAIDDMWAALGENGVTETQLLQTLDEMLFANLDVTMGGISWNLVLLAANPTVQERLVAELQAHEADQAGLVLSSSTLLAACALESARLKPLAAFSVPQSAPTPRVLDGYVVPAGTSFIVDTHALNMNEAFWGQDSGLYRPERFLEKTGSAARYNYWRFGFGPRQCMGKYVADLITRSLLANMLPEWRLEDPKGDGEWDRVAGTWINHPQGELNVIKRLE